MADLLGCFESLERFLKYCDVLVEDYNDEQEIAMAVVQRSRFEQWPGGRYPILYAELRDS